MADRRKTLAALFFAALGLLPGVATGQSLLLSSATASAGATVSLNLSLSSGAGSALAGLEWTLTYTPSAIGAITVSAGAALQSSGKSVSCAAGNGSYTCLATGLNTTIIPDGVVAVVSITLSSTFSGTVIGASNVLGASLAGSAVPVTATGATLSLAASSPVPAPSPSSGSAPGTAAFVAFDGTTAGSWKGTYGADGYTVVGDLTAYPQYVTVTPAGQYPYTWASSTTDARALQKASSLTDRIAAAWYSAASFSIDLNFSDSTTHRVALYCLDWDRQQRSQTLTVLDAATNTVLDVRTVSNFSNGQYLIWSLSGHVKIQVARTGGPSAVLSGVFLGGGSVPVTSAPFVKTDLATEGTWRGVYGSDGYNVIGDATAYPAYVTVTPAGQSQWLWASSTADPRALQKASSATDRIAAAWYSRTAFTLDLQFNDTVPHQVALYCLDWDYRQRSQTISILDAATNAVLDTRAISNFGSGAYLVWSLSGHVRIQVVATGSPNAVLSGIFFQSGGAQPAPGPIVPPVLVSGLQCVPGTVGPNSSSTCTVTLNQAAPSAGSTVALSDNSSVVTVPSSATVAAGSTTARFAATVGNFSSNQSATITASLNGGAQSSTLSLAVPPAVTSLKCSPSHLSVGSTGTCAMSLANVSVNTTVSISTNAPSSLSVPSTYTVAAGAPSASFSAKAIAPYSGLAVVTATLAASSASDSFNIGSHKPAVVISQVTCDGSGLVGGTSTQCAVQLATAAEAGGRSIRLSTDNPRLRIPATVQVAEGQVSAEFTVQSQPSDRDENGTIVAAAGDSAQAATLDLTGVRPVSLACAPQPLAAGATATCELRLNSSDIGEPISLAITSGSHALRVPASVKTRARQSSLSFEAVAAPDAGGQTATLTASFGSNTLQQTLSLAGGSGPVLHVPGKQLAAFGTAIQFGVTATDPAGTPVQLAAANLPAGAAFDAGTGTFAWTPDQSQQGTYDVAFTATDALQASTTQHVTIEVDGGAPAITAVVNGATRQAQAACSPGAVASLWGKRLAGEQAPAADPTGNSLELAGTRVKVNDAYVPVLYAAPGAVDFLCPAVAPGTPLQIAVETVAGNTDPVQISMAASGPGVYALDRSGKGQGAVFFAGTSEAAATRSFRAAGQPAQPGDRLAIWVTGLAPDAPAPVVKIGDAYAIVESVQPLDGLAGLSEIRVALPDAVPYGDRVPVTVQTAQPDATLRDSNTVSIAIEPVRQ